jgi:putative DNA primase/helicase
MSDHIDQFRRAIAAAGLPAPVEIVDDGNLHRFSTSGKRGDDSGWYVLYGDSIPAGSFGCWRSGLTSTWCVRDDRDLSASERQANRERVEFMKRQREAEEARLHEQAAATAAELWQAGRPADETHGYLRRKGIKPHCTRVQADGWLLVPMRDSSGKLWNVERIAPEKPQDGTDKKGLWGGRRKGLYYGIGKPGGALIVCEGFATGASIHECTGHAVAVAFNAGNLEAVAVALRTKYPALHIVIAADDDHMTAGNPGISKATAAACLVRGTVAIPDFGGDRDPDMTDFNDLMILDGAEAVARAIANASAPARGEYQLGEDDAPAGDSEGNGWPDPHPLAAKIEPEPYPIDALPLPIRAAVEEVAGFVKAPVPMVASSALAALSLAIQAHANAKRAEKLHGPVGLFLLTIADSGERKSTCDGFFTRAIRDYEEAQAEAAKPVLKDHRAEIEAWEAKRGGVKEKIRQLAKDNKPTASMESALRDLEHDKPEPPRIPRLLYADATPEALAYGLAKQWPSGGVVSAEAGIVFGSHGMGKDSVMRNLGLLNQLWDGTSLTIDRRSTESFTVRGARLTVALQVQEPTLREFFTRSGALARGTGFLARFLVAWPESTQGQRPFTDPPTNWPHLAAFHRRIAAILDQPAPIGEDGVLTPPMLPLTPEAKAAWVEYHNAIEGELSSGGELYDVRDVASKSADNAARLAALFQMFEGAGGAIGADAFEGASRITAWHLHEARRFFGELALPAELADAARLDSWLIEYCQRERTHLVPTREAQRLGPIRDKEKLTTALRELEELDRVKVAQEGRRKTIKVNPALVVTP